MARQRRRRRGLSRAFYSDPTRVEDTLEQPAIHEAGVARILELTMRIGEQLLAVGASAREATVAMRDVAQAYDLHGLQADVTFNSVTVSYHRPGERPMTMMRVVHNMEPDHSKFQRIQLLLARIDNGMGLAEALEGIRGIRRTPFRYRSLIVAIARAVVAVGVGIMYDGSPVILALTFVAALAAALTQAGLTTIKVPPFFRQVAGAFVITSVAVGVSALGEADVEPFTDVRPAIIVSSGIVVMLAGLALVGAVKDAIDGFSITAGGRILELILQTVGVVLGIYVGLELGRLLGYGIPLPEEALPRGSLLHVLAGAFVLALAVAISNGGDARLVLISGVLSVSAAGGYSVAESFGFSVVAASAIGAIVGAFLGTMISRASFVPSVAVTTAAIIPLVPGAMVFRGLLQIATSDKLEGTLAGMDLLAHAAMIAVALAVGAALGNGVGLRGRRARSIAAEPPSFVGPTR